MKIGLAVRTIFVVSALLALTSLLACGQEPADHGSSTVKADEATETLSCDQVVEAPTIIGYASGSETEFEKRSGRVVETPIIIPAPEVSPVPKDTRISGPVPAATIPFPSPVRQKTRLPKGVLDMLTSARRAMEKQTTYAFSIEGEVLGQTASGDTVRIPISYAGDSFVGYNSVSLAMGGPQDTTALRTASVHPNTALGDDPMSRDTYFVFDAEKRCWVQSDELPALSALTNPYFLFGQHREYRRETSSLMPPVVGEYEHGTMSFAARSDMRKLPTQTLNGDEALVMSGRISVGDPDNERAMDVTYWVTEKDGLLRKLTASGPFDPAPLGIQPENTPPLSDPQVELTATFSDYGKVIDYRSPVISSRRFSHDAVLLEDGRVLIYGGFSGALSDNVNPPFPRFFSEIYDPKERTWSFVERIWEATAEPLTLGVFDFNLFIFSRGVVLDDGSIAAPGVALEGTGGDAALATLNDARTSWTKMSDMPNPRVFASAALLGDGRVLVTGGGDSAAEAYDPQTGVWQSLAPMNVATFNHAHVSLEDGRMLAIGGTLDDFTNGPGTARVEIYDPQADAWELASAMNVPRARPRAVTLQDGRILLAGKPPYSFSSIFVDVAPSSEVFDPESGGWTLTSPMTEPRTNHTLTLLPDGTVLAAGGNDPRETMHVPLASTEIFDPTADTWTAGPDLAHARSEHTATLMPDGSVLFIGGVMQQESDDPLASVEFLTP